MDGGFDTTRQRDTFGGIPLRERSPWEVPPQQPPAPPASRGGRGGWLPLLASALVAALVSAVVTLGITGADDEAAAARTPFGERNEETAAEPEQDPVTQTVLPAGSTIAEIAEQRLPSVAQVLVSGQQGTGSGSAVVYAEDGLLVTNNHVVRGARDLEVQLSNAETYPAEVVGTDPRSDLALLRIEATDLPVPEYAESSPGVGATAIAIGSPFGLESTVTSGIISGTDRPLEGNPGEPTLIGMLQTDAAINPGNSGGALIDDRGRIIGINTAIYSRTGSFAGIGFAIPVETVRDVVEKILQDGDVTYAFLGVGTQSITPPVARQFDLPVEEGALVANVDPDSPAGEAGIEPGDIILRVGETDVTGTPDLLQALRTYEPGDETTVVFLSDGAEERVEVTLAATEPLDQ